MSHEALFHQNHVFFFKQKEEPCVHWHMAHELKPWLGMISLNSLSIWFQGSVTKRARSPRIPWFESFNQKMNKTIKRSMKLKNRSKYINNHSTYSWNLKKHEDVNMSKLYYQYITNIKLVYYLKSSRPTAAPSGRPQDVKVQDPVLYISSGQVQAGPKAWLKHICCA